MTNPQFPLDIQYKGLTATIKVDEQASLLRGYVTGPLWEITFSGRDLQETEQAFQRTVDEYLKMYLADYAQSSEISDERCGEQSNANMTVIPIHLPNEIIQLIHIYRQDKTVEELIVDAVVGEIKSRQRSDEIWRVFDIWNQSHKIIEVTPLETFSLRVKFEDGLEGEYDMNSTIQNVNGFSILANVDFFQKVSIGENGDTIFWPDELVIGASVIYEAIMADLDNANYKKGAR